LIVLIINAHPALGARSRIRAFTLTGGTLIRKTSLQDRTDNPCGQAWADKRRA
jgi:chorismate-pyruvate lyase